MRETYRDPKVHDPEAMWRVRFFVRVRYIDMEIQAPNENVAKLFAHSALLRDGDFAAHEITWIKTERIG